MQHWVEMDKEQSMQRNTDLIVWDFSYFLHKVRGPGLVKTIAKLEIETETNATKLSLPINFFWYFVTLGIE